MGISYLPLDLGQDKANDLVHFLLDKLRLTITARANQIEKKYKQWRDNYEAEPLEAVRTTPFRNASNFIPQLSRMHSDILAARLIGIIFGAKPLWKVRSLTKLPHEVLEGLSQWMEFKTTCQMDFYEPMDDVINQTVKYGTVVTKSPFVEEEIFIRLAKAGLIGPTSEKNVGSSSVCIDVIPFEDFFPYPITAKNLKSTNIRFQRLRFTREEAQYRIDTGRWDKDNGQLVLNAQSKPEANREAEASKAGIGLVPDIDRPYDVFECWLDYPILPGKMYKIVLWINPYLEGPQSILRAVHNYYSKGIEPFTDWRIMRRDGLFYGYSIPEVLEQSQEEQAQIHNSRRDANKIANVPGWKKRRYADVPNPQAEWYPGKVFELEDMADLDVLQFNVKYNDMIQEEQFLLDLADRYSGVGPPMQGYGAGVMSGKRGIYNAQGTMQMLSEGNRRLDIYIRRLRYGFHNQGNIIYQSEKDFNRDGMEYALEEGGEYVQKTFEFQEPDKFKGFLFDISATDAGANREIDRTNLLLMANTMASYYRQVVEAASIITQIPDPNHPLRAVMLEVLSGARDLANRLLFYYEIGDRNRLLPDVKTILGAGTADPLQNAAQRSGLPGVEGANSQQGLRALAGRLSAITGGGNT